MPRRNKRVTIRATSVPEGKLIWITKKKLLN